MPPAVCGIARMMALLLRVRLLFVLVLTAGLTACTAAGEEYDANVLRVAPHSDLTILDPIWTTATISQDHGFMIYDTLFGMDVDGRIRPQMVESYDTSPDRLTWTFRLRSGLAFHDGTPVTSEDAIASIQRWGQRDTMGQTLLSFVAKWDVVDDRTFRMTLTAPYAMVLESLGKPAASVPFIMPKRVAATPADRQIDEFIGSGPFIFMKDEWKPGEKVVYR